MAADPRGFLVYEREAPPKRPVAVRVRDWHEVTATLDDEAAERQARRCMDCGIPFCHTGCPLGNLIPEFNELAGLGHVERAAERLLATNNFPEFTGRLCPAPCEAACVLGINRDPVAIEAIERYLSDEAWRLGVDRPQRPSRSTGRKVVVVGSGPTGLAAAQQLRRAGHEIELLERHDRAGGLLRYGIPEFKLEKALLDRRLAQLEEEGVQIRTGVRVGADVTLSELVAEADAVVLALGSTRPRDLVVEGRQGPGVVFAMDYLRPANLEALGTPIAGAPSARDARVVIIGGGDTGADCLGTAHRQGARSVVQLEILPEPPRQRRREDPWPTYPVLLRTSTAHEEGGERRYARRTLRIERHPDGRVAGLVTEAVELVEGALVAVPNSEELLEADLVVLAMGFVGPELDQLDPERALARTHSGTIATDERFATSVPGVFAAGDARRGQSLIVWAIAEGRSVAHEVDAWLMGASDLPKPIQPSARPLSAA
jgi:glutamate synthase (NADPH/NADH) small chain